MRRLALALITLTVAPLLARADDPRAKPLLEKIALTKGICVLLNETGALPASLAKQSDLTIFVQLETANEAEKLRKSLDQEGLLGTRIYVQSGPLTRLHLADDLADAVIAPSDTRVSPAEVLRILRPQGKAFLGDKALTKGFREGTDEWSHPYHGPDNNPQSADTVARRPFMTHYMAEPWYCPLPMMSVISGGRIFKVFGDRSSAKPQEPLVNKLLAMNAFNGTVLWQRDLSPGFMIHRNTLIATPETLYLGDDKSLQMIDAATGKVRDQFVVPADKSDGPVWKWMALEDGVLYALVGEKETSDDPLKGDRIRGAGWPWWKISKYQFGFGKNLLALDPKTKQILWHHRETDPIDSRGMALRKGKLFFTSEGKHLAALDARSGTLLWRNSDKDLLEALGSTRPAQHWLLGFASTAYLKASDDALFFAGPNRPLLVAASTKNGKLLWSKDCSVKMAGGNFPTEGGNVLLVVRPEGLYALGQGRTNTELSSFKLNPLTGETLATFPGRDRCTRATGCADTIFTRGGKGGSTAVFDVASQEPRMGTLSPMRPACQDGVVAAHGYLFWGPWMCRCDMTQLGVISLGSADKIDHFAKATELDRLETPQGPNDVQTLADDLDWPSYRHDNQRTVLTPHVTPEKIALAWTYQPKTPRLPTAPIAVAGKVYIGGSDGVLRALDAQTGAVRWSAYTGGPLKYPPAFAESRLFVGGGDGHIHAFAASSGRLAWRFRAAPIERTMPVYGNLSSTWPVCGVLVDKGIVYGAAGISNFDGTHVYALKANSGNILWQHHSASGQDGDDLPTGGVSVQGPMILHQNAVHMAAGNTPPIAAYALADGKFTPSAASRGKDLFIRNGKVQGSGFPLYWRPEDDQFLSTMELECPAGVLHVGTPSADPTAPAKLALHSRDAKPRELWSHPQLFQEIAAVAFTKNAVLITGLNRTPKNSQNIKAELAALSLETGKLLWRTDLPATPTAWGLALDRDNRILVTLIDGRVLAFQ